jgi:glycosyltransferase involved in cell wall biosynthesis
MMHERSIAPPEPKGAVRLSIGIIVRNEEETIGPMLSSLFRQNVFERLAQQGSVCEIICVANGCTDRTAEIAQAVFDEQARDHPLSAAFRCRVESLTRAGKLQAWNEYVHRLSAREAECLFVADGDIVIHRTETLGNMLRTLEQNPAATAVTDEPLKDIAFKSRKTWTEKLSLAASRMTRNQPAQLTGQLYGIRSAVARNIYLPQDLPACEDGFIKTLVCTRFLTRPARPRRNGSSRRVMPRTFLNRTWGWWKSCATKSGR